MKHLKQQGGFTLIEILGTLAIISIGFVAILQIFGSTNTLSRRSRNLLTATKFAQGRLEYYRTMDYDNITAPFQQDLSSSMPAGLLGVSGADCVPPRTACMVMSIVGNVKQLDMYVYYQEGNATKSVHLTTQVARNGIGS